MGMAANEHCFGWHARDQYSHIHFDQWRKHSTPQCYKSFCCWQRPAGQRSCVEAGRLIKTTDTKQLCCTFCIGPRKLRRRNFRGLAEGPVHIIFKSFPEIQRPIPNSLRHTISRWRPHPRECEAQPGNWPIFAAPRQRLPYLSWFCHQRRKSA
jgi:hypothetical protein